MRNYKRILSIFIITTFISANTHITSLAQGIDDLASKIVASAQIGRDTKKGVKILQEEVSKREKSVKTFIKEDKSYEAVVYPLAAHYKENGTWKDIDNNLVEGKDEENNGVLVNKNNSYKVEFGKTSNAKKLVSIKKDGYEVSWNINTPNDSANNILSEDIAISENSTSTTEPNVVAPAGSEVQEKVPVEETTNLVNTTESQVVQESTVTQTVNSNLLKAVNTTSAQVKPKNTDYLSKLSWVYIITKAK